MWRGFEQRGAFCRSVLPLVPQTDSDWGIWAPSQIVKGAAEPLITAVLDIFKSALNDDMATIHVIEAEFGAASWPSFTSVRPAR